MLRTADAADDEGRCVKAELEVLRSHARRSGSRHLPSSGHLPGSETLAMHMDDSSQNDDALSVSSQHEGQQSGTVAVQPLAEQQQQGQGQLQGRGQGQIPAGQGSEAELAAVEQGLSALEQQITAAALRYLSGAKSGTKQQRTDGNIVLLGSMTTGHHSSKDQSVCTCNHSCCLEPQHLVVSVCGIHALQGLF